MINSELLFKLYKLKRKYRLDDGDFKESDHMRAPKGAKDKDGNAIGGRWVEKSQIANLKELGIEDDTDENAEENKSQSQINNVQSNEIDYGSKKTNMPVTGSSEDYSDDEIIKMLSSVWSRPRKEKSKDEQEISERCPELYLMFGRELLDKNLRLDIIYDIYSFKRESSELYAYDKKMFKYMTKISGDDFDKKLISLADDFDIDTGEFNNIQEKDIDELLGLVDSLELDESQKQTMNDMLNDIKKYLPDMIELSKRSRIRALREQDRDNSHNQGYENNELDNSNLMMTQSDFEHHSDIFIDSATDKLGISISDTNEMKKRMRVFYKNNPRLMSLYGKVFQTFCPTSLDEYNEDVDYMCGGNAPEMFKLNTSAFTEDDRILGRSFLILKKPQINGSILNNMFQTMIHESGHALDAIFAKTRNLIVRDTLDSGADYLSICENLAQICGTTLDIKGDYEYNGTTIIDKETGERRDIFDESLVDEISDALRDDLDNSISSILDEYPEYKEYKSTIMRAISDMIGSVSCGKIRCGPTHSSNYYESLYRAKRQNLISEERPRRSVDQQSSENFTNFLTLQIYPFREDINEKILKRYFGVYAKTLESSYESVLESAINS